MSPHTTISRSQQASRTLPNSSRGLLAGATAGLASALLLFAAQGPSTAIAASTTHAVAAKKTCKKGYRKTKVGKPGHRRVKCVKTTKGAPPAPATGPAVASPPAAPSNPTPGSATPLPPSVPSGPPTGSTTPPPPGPPSLPLAQTSKAKAHTSQAIGGISHYAWSEWQQGAWQGYPYLWTIQRITVQYGYLYPTFYYSQWYWDGASLQHWFDQGEVRGSYL